jgi:hypothetical protein
MVLPKTDSQAASRAGEGRGQEFEKGAADESLMQTRGGGHDGTHYGLRTDRPVPNGLERRGDSVATAIL